MKYVIDKLVSEYSFGIKDIEHCKKMSVNKSISPENRKKYLRCVSWYENELPQLEKAIMILKRENKK